MTEAPVNFLYIMTDQHRADYLSCAGHPLLKTPNIDRIAQGGTRFNRFYVANPVCMPNRASILTGRMTSINGARCNGLPLPLNSNTFVRQLAKAGYHTASIGKNHVQNMGKRPSFVRDNKTATWPVEQAQIDPPYVKSVESIPEWEAGNLSGVQSDFHGYEHVEVVSQHGDRASGAYYEWAKKKGVDLADLRGPENQHPHNYSCPQAVRTAVPEELYSTTYIKERSVEWLQGRRDDDRPFFGFVSFPDPHHPFTPPGKYWDMYSPDDVELPENFMAHENPPPTLQWVYEQGLDPQQEGGFQTAALMVDERQAREAIALTMGMIAMIDDAIGAILDTLEAQGLAENTVVVFNSDHGDFMADHGMILKGPLHFDSVIRVPFLWNDPTCTQVETTETLGSSIDVGATILKRAGLEPFWGMQGIDLTPALEGHGLRRASVMVEDESYRFLFGKDETTRVRSLVTDRYRMSIYRDEDWGELYDLHADPGETRNLWDDPSYADVRSDLMFDLVQQLTKTADTSPIPEFIA